MEHAYFMKYSLSQTIILCFEVFEHNDIIETIAAHLKKKTQVVKLEMFSD